MSAGRNGRLTLILSLGLSGTIGYLAASWATSPVISVSPPPEPTSIGRPTLLKCSDSHIDLGNVEQGGHRETTVWLENPNSETIEIDVIRTSCDCFEVILEAMRVPGNQKVRAVVKVDFSDDPFYRGRLLLGAEGTAKDNEAYAFLIKANVTVR